MVQHGIHSVRRCFLPRKLARTAASSKWAPILIRTPARALVCARSMAVSAEAVTKESILTIWVIFWIVEDVGGTTVMNNGRNPNSFVYRFVPVNPNDLTHGKLQALQVSINGNPLVFVPVDDAHPNGDTRSNNQLLLHTIGASWPVTLGYAFMIPK